MLYAKQWNKNTSESERELLFSISGSQPLHLAGRQEQHTKQNRGSLFRAFYDSGDHKCNVFIMRFKRSEYSAGCPFRSVHATMHVITTLEQCICVGWLMSVWRNNVRGTKLPWKLDTLFKVNANNFISSNFWMAYAFGRALANDLKNSHLIINTININTLREEHSMCVCFVRIDTKKCVSCICSRSWCLYSAPKCIQRILQ